MRPLSPPRLLPLFPTRRTHPHTPCTAPTFNLPLPPPTSRKSYKLKFSASLTVAQAPQCLRARHQCPSLKAMEPHRAPASPPPPLLPCPTWLCLLTTLRTRVLAWALGPLRTAHQHLRGSRELELGLTLTILVCRKPLIHSSRVDPPLTSWLIQQA